KPRPDNLIIGVNLGKNKDTPNEEAAQDYLTLMDTFGALADYLVINVSSPNTLGLRQLQARQALDDLLKQISPKREMINAEKHTPLLVKISPDLSDEELEDVLDILISHHIDGVIATNTTIQRNGLLPESLVHPSLASQTGGLSGAPLFRLSLSMVEKIVQKAGEQLPVIGVGGIMDVTQARKMLEAGAKLIQVYTGLIYNGPAFVKNLLRSL
ncbi:MAG: dihydroorotate dehydrogenase (quinone), partial [Anaerolineales bacterium]